MAEAKTTANAAQHFARVRAAKKKAHRRPRPPLHISAGSVKNEINVTPLVDVVLVLLIIFMVVTPMLSRGIAVDLPTTAFHRESQDKGDEIIVAIAADGRVFVEADAAEGEMLPERLKVSMKKHPGGQIHVKADKRLTYGKVRAVLEKIHEMGVAKVALGSDKRKEGK